MKKILLTFAVMICGACPILAMEPPKEDFDIRAITPIKKGMLPEQRREAIQSFLKESLKPEYAFKTAEVSSTRWSLGGRLFQTTCTLNDGSEWIKGEGGLNRFLGHLYLKKAIEHYELKNLCVVETRYAYLNPKSNISINIHPNGLDKLENIPVIDSMDFFTLSRYVGNERITPEYVEKNPKIREELEILDTKIGFTDTYGYANLIRQNGKIYIMDTEYASFSNSYAPYHDERGEQTFTFSIRDFED